jgi:McrBC 5-methylcytosine restriction system component
MIKIKNIFHMLAYAFQALDEEKYSQMSFENFENVEDLLAAILARGVANQIKRGLCREYILTTEPLRSPRGGIDFSETLKHHALQTKLVVCEFDDYSANTYHNKILKTTMHALLCSENVNLKQKKELRKLIHFFHATDKIRKQEINWSRLKYHRNNSAYKLLMNICYLALECLLPNTSRGETKFVIFKEDQMHRLYERFLREYYRKHYPEFTVSAAHIDWLVDDGINNLLPSMNTDVTIDYGDKTLIIDAKYYGRTMQTSYEKQTIHSGNLYQIFTYVKNKDVKNTGNVSGLLLYAKTDEEITPDNSYQMNGNRIDVRTLNLNMDFSDIELQLDAIVEGTFGSVNNSFTV